MSFDWNSQPRAAAFFKKAVTQGRLPHGLLFIGPEAAAQREAAEGLARILLCAARKNFEACGECPSCRLKEHPDLIRLEPEEDSRTIKIEAVRGVISKAFLKPFQAPVKCFIIDPAEALGEDSQNALLKTLEEPPANSIFILLCRAGEKILPTVHSRLSRVTFLPKAGKEPENAELKAAALSVQNAVLSPDPRAAAVPDLGGFTREEAAAILEQTVQSLREALLIQAGAGALLADVEDKPAKRRLAEGVSEDELIARLETVAAFREKILHSANLKLALAVLWEEICPKNFT